MNDNASARDSLSLPIVHQSRVQPDRPALWWRAEEISYRALAERADDLARRLAGAGATAGDRVAVLLPNRPLYAALLHAAARLQVALVPLNPRLTAGEVGWQVADADPCLVIYDRTLADRLADVEPEVTLVAAGPGGPAGDLSLADLAPVDQPLSGAVPLGTPLAIVYTSGTTGRPKGAVLTHGNFTWGAVGSALRLGQQPDDRWLVPLPLCHIGGLAVLWRSALYGTAVVLQPRFDAAEVARALEEEVVSQLSLVPVMLQRLLVVWDDRPAPSALRAVLLGGGAASEELVIRARALGFPICPTYGLTEAASQVATVPPGRGAVRPGSAGPPLVVTEVRIVAADGTEQPAGSEGEIQVRGPTVMSGYWNAPAATGAALAGGWLHSGDIGWLAEDGELFVLDRRESLVVTGGENVYPAEIEAVLDAHPGVAASCVVGLPDPVWGAVVVAAVEALPGAARDPEELARYLREHLAGYKIPRRIVWLDALPRTASGKPSRAAVRRLLEAGSEPDGSDGTGAPDGPGVPRAT